MKQMVIASVFASIPISAMAADLSKDYSFIQDNAPPAALAPSVVGHIELSAGWWQRQLNDTGQVDEAVRLEGHGRVNIPFAGNWNLELETGGVWLINTDNGISDVDLSNFGGFAHLWVDLSGVRLGVFGGGDYLDNFSTLSIWTGGAEGEIDIGSNLTLGLQGSYSDPDCSSCDSANFISIVGWADFYPAPNTKLGVQTSYIDFIDIDSSTFQLWNVWGTVEQRFAGMPLSLFARGGYEASSDQVFEAYTVFAGLRLFFDGNALSLQEHDHQVPFEYRLPQIAYSFGL